MAWIGELVSPALREKELRSLQYCVMLSVASLCTHGKQHEPRLHNYNRSGVCTQYGFSAVGA